jgi:molecular chaperone HtpG
MSETTDEKAATGEKLAFQAETAKLLHIVANSLYGERDVFLRELISNASDACDRLRYEAITDPALTAGDPEFRVVLTIDKKAKTLTIADNGIGMDRDELIANLGTIARSGTGAFIDSVGEDGDDDGVSLIGQFGVGFYSTFMVAGEVTVISRKAGSDTAWAWTSDGKGEFTVTPAEREGRGTAIALRLTKAAKDYLDPATLKRIIMTYSDHVALPIVLAGGGEDGEDETLNVASALWTRPKKEITDEQYKEFYHHVGRTFDDPWLTVHARIEGKVEYTVLLFVPTMRPFDLFDPARAHHVKLYVKRVFVTDECEGLVPPYLRFLRGIVDSQDLDLNVSREVLQSSPMVAKIRKDIVKRLLREFGKKAEKDAEGYEKFWTEFGPVLKEGLYEDQGSREALLKIARFHSTNGDGLVSLADYAGRMKENQTAIYYISGSDAEALAKSPQIEGFRARGLEVLLLSDPVDDFWVQTADGFDGKPFTSVTRGDADFDNIPVEAAGDEDAKKEEADDDSLGTLIALLKLKLGDAVKDVRVSKRLTDSPVCLVVDDSGVEMHLERLLKQHGRLDQVAPPILEINASHELIRTIADLAKKEGAAAALADAAQLLFDQARIIEGEMPADPVAFSRRFSAIMAKGLSG